jgi:hypothetical protein
VRSTIVLLLALLAFLRAAAAAQPELIDRTLAIIAGQPITLSDVRGALALGLIDAPAGPDQISAATRKLIDRMLVLREVQRFVPAEPPDIAVDARVTAVSARFASPEAFRAALAAAGFSEALVRGWARDDLRTTEYLNQRFAAAGLPTDEEVAAAFAAQRDEYDKSGNTYERAAPAIRQRLAAERRAELITDWISDLRRRTPVVELVKQ